MSLLRLPVELQEHVLQQTSPRGYEACMLSCRRLFDAGRPQLEQHNNLRRRYRHVSFRGPARSEQCMLNLLYEIAKEPLAADFIEIADLRHDRSAEPVTPSNISWKIFFDEAGQEEFPTILKQLLEGSKILRAANIDFEAWSREILNRQPVPTLMLLLTLLPNVRELVFPARMSGFMPYMGSVGSPVKDDIETVFILLSDTTNAGQNPDRPLSNLIRISNFDKPPGYSYSGVRTLAPFIDIPSVKELIVASGYVPETHPECRPWTRQPRIARAEFAASQVIGSGLAHLLAPTSPLRSFKLAYEHQGSKHQGSKRPSSWDAAELFGTLELHWGSTVRELSVTSFGWVDFLKGGLHSLKNFVVLERLELDVDFFYGPPITEESRSMTPSEYRDYAYSTAWSASSVPSLTEILPSSIKTIQLNAGFIPADTEVVKSLFKGFKDRRSECLPYLEDIVVRRATRCLGQRKVRESVDAASWQAVNVIVTESGGLYEEVDDARASWLKTFPMYYPGLL